MEFKIYKNGDGEGTYINDINTYDWGVWMIPNNRKIKLWKEFDILIHTPTYKYYL